MNDHTKRDSALYEIFSVTVAYGVSIAPFVGLIALFALFT